MFFTDRFNAVIPHDILTQFTMRVNSLHGYVCLHAFMLAYVYAYESGLVIECAQVARVISVSDRMMLGEAVHINPIHMCEA